MGEGSEWLEGPEVEVDGLLEEEKKHIDEGGY